MLEALSNPEQAIRNFSIAFIPAFLGIILHEMGHGWVALRQGDTTARNMGRLTLNPIAHIDPVGLLMFVLTATLGSFVFGWAKPVPINVRNFRNPRQGLMLTALAGPVTNILLAILFGVLLKATLTFFPYDDYAQSSSYMFALSVMQMGIIINLGLALFNLFPIPPLDGSKVISFFMPVPLAVRYLSIGASGMLILVILLASGVLGPIIRPILQGSFNLIIGVLGIA